MGLIARFLMALAAPLAALFVTQDAANFGVVQMMVAVLLFTGLAGVLAFWPHGRSKSTPTE